MNEDEDLGNDIDDGVPATPAAVVPPAAPPATPAAATPDPEAAAQVEKTIPMSRFSVVIGQRNAEREARQRLEAELEAAKAPPIVTSEEIKAQIAAKGKERNALLLNGQEDEASKLDEEIMELMHTRATNAAFERIQAEKKAEADKVAAKAEQDAIDEIVANNPVISQKHADFDEVLFKKVCRLADSYATEMPMSEAIKTALSDLRPESVTPTPATPPAKPTESSAHAKAKIAAAIPPALGTQGRSNQVGTNIKFTSEGIRSMTDAQFRSMTPDEEAEMLGNG